MNERAGVQAFETGLKVLSAFVGLHEPAMLKTIAERAGMAPAKAHRYLASLCKAGFVRQETGSSRYRLAEGALRIGMAAANGIEVVRVARPLVASLRHELNQTAFLAVWGTAGPTVVSEMECHVGQVKVAAGVGTVLPLLTSATGFVFAAWLPRPVTSPLMARELGALRRHRREGAPATLEEVEKLLSAVRSRGLASVSGLLNPAVDALSAPVFDSQGALAAAISVIAPAGMLDMARDGKLAKKLQSAAASASDAMGFVKRSS